MIDYTKFEHIRANALRILGKGPGGLQPVVPEQEMAQAVIDLFAEIESQDVRIARLEEEIKALKK